MDKAVFYACLDWTAGHTRYAPALVKGTTKGSMTLHVRPIQLPATNPTDRRPGLGDDLTAQCPDTKKGLGFAGHEILFRFVDMNWKKRVIARPGG